jgi:hypothetical protein
MNITLVQLVPTLQLAVGPVILISGVGLLLLSFTNRLGRLIDRARLLHRERLSGPTPARQVLLREQIGLIDRRAGIEVAVFGIKPLSQRTIGIRKITVVVHHIPVSNFIERHLDSLASLY